MRKIILGLILFLVLMGLSWRFPSRLQAQTGFHFGGMCSCAWESSCFLNEQQGGFVCGWRCPSGCGLAGGICYPGYYMCNNPETNKNRCCPIGRVGGCTGCGCWCACGFDDMGGETGHDCGKSCCAQCYVQPYPNSCMCAHSNYNADKTCPWGQRLSDEWVDAGWCLDRQHSRFHPRARRAFCW